MRVLLLDGNQNQSVAAVRSLAKAGYAVLVGESDAWSKAGWSRSCLGTFRYPDPRIDAVGFVKRVAQIAAQEPGTLVLPMTEKTMLPTSAYRDFLQSANARVVLPSHQQVLQAFNKDEMVRLASSLGIAVPKTVAVRSVEQMGDLRGKLSFPVVLKPRSSVEAQSDGSVRISGRPRYAKNELELQECFREMMTRCSEILVQEFVDGNGTGYFALMRQGELRAEFAHRRIRDVNPTGSGSALRVSVAPDPVVREASLAMLRSLRWHGVAMVEFRQEARKAPVFMEVNGRFWNSLPLACYAGMDFPALLARMAEAGDVEPQLQFRTGVSCRWLLGDFRHLVEVWRGAPAGYPRTYPGRLQTLLSVLTPVPGTFHDNFHWQDPMPEAGDWLSFIRHVFQKLSHSN
jgi:predicted ATP-grasp superfamily ATP-dependent carboligase